MSRLIGTLPPLTRRILRWLSVALLLVQVALAGETTALLEDRTIEPRALVWALFASIPLIPLATAALYAGMASENARSSRLSSSWTKFAGALSRICDGDGSAPDRDRRGRCRQRDWLAARGRGWIAAVERVCWP